MWSSAGSQRQEVERLRLARSFGGAVKSCLADRCYAESCLVGRCYARQIFESLLVWTDERRAVAPWTLRWMSGMIMIMQISLLKMDQWSDDDDGF